MIRLFQRHIVYLLIHLVLLLLGFVLLAFVPPGENISSLVGTLIVGIAGSLIASGVIGWVVLVYILVSEQRLSYLSTADKFGLIDMWQVRQVRIRDKYEPYLRKARDHIDIVGFGLSAFRQDFATDFPVWATRCKMRVLLIDPEFPTEASFANLRDVEEGQTAGTIATQVREFISETLGKFPELRDNDNFRVKLYRAIPAINVFRIDNVIFWGPYFVGVSSRNTPTFLVRSTGLLYPELQRHFEAIWCSRELTREVPRGWYG